MTAMRSSGRFPALAANTPGHLLNLVRSRDNWTRQQLLTETGLSRTTLFSRLGQLFRAGFAYESGAARSTGGRPSSLVRFEDRGRVVLVIDLGHRHGRLAVATVGGTTLRQTRLSIDIAQHPRTLLPTVYDLAQRLLDEGTDEILVGVGVAVPGPVSPVTGRLTETTIMPGWDRYPLNEEIEQRWQVPVLLENDARAYALGESVEHPEASPLVAVKYANGIGAGIVLDGQLLCGVGGAAGDIGHIRITDARGRRCRCGRGGCLAAYASGHALLRQLRRPAEATVDDLATSLATHPATETAVRAAASLLGRTLASLVATLNPQVIILGGVLGRTPAVVEEVRTQIHALAIDRVTNPLTVAASTAHHPVGTGLTALVTGHVYAPDNVDAALTV